MTDCDSDLLKRYSDEKSEAAFAELVRRHLNMVYSTANRLVRGDTHLAKDISQRVFTDLARKGSSLRHYSQLAGWLYTSTRFAACEAIRTEQRRRARELKAGDMNDSPNDPVADIEWSQLRSVLDELMEQLSEADQAALLLRFFEHQSIADIGRTLGLSEGAASKRIARALERLREGLNKRGVRSSGAVLAACLTANAATAAPAGLANTISSGAVMAGSTASIWSGATFIKIKAALAFAVLTGAAVEIVLQHLANRHLQSEMTELRTAQSSATPLSISGSAGNSKLVEAEIAELTAKLREHANRSAARSQAPGSGMVPLAEYTNAGNANPGEAFETICWAKERIEVAVLARLIDFDEIALNQAEETFAHLSPAVKAKFPDVTDAKQMLVLAWAVGTEPFVAIEVSSVSARSNDEVVLQAQWQDPTRQTNGREMDFRRDSTGWKWNVSPEHAQEILHGIVRTTGSKFSP
jgi:RNA polymerase sigma factor (sigma-70 family)